MEWKSVEGFEGRYEVSDAGEVKSILTGKVLKPGRQSKGYLTVCLYDGSSPKKPKSKTVHSIVAEAFIGPRAEGMGINHINGLKSDNRVYNLEYCSPSSNMQHSIANGLSGPPKSENAKLSGEQVEMIRAMFRSDPPKGLKDCLARAMDVSESTIRNVVKGKYYKDSVSSAT